MKNKLLIVSLLAAVSHAPAMAQGTLQDYKRAYSLYEKFNASNVYHWASDIRWKDSTHVFHYATNTPEGRRFVSYNVDNGQGTTYQTEEELRTALGLKQPEPQQPQFGRQKQRHWMEVDEEQTPYPVASPDGKLEAYVEGQNLVVHEVGKPYTEKRVLTQDGTIGNYYSNQILWSPDSRKIFVCKRRAVEKRYVYYVESSPKDQLQPILHKQEYAKPGDELPQRVPMIFDVQSGKRWVGDTALCGNQYELGWFEWTPDSREVTMEYNQRGHKIYRVLAMNAETGAMRTIVEERAQTFVNYNRTFRKYINNGTQLIWMSERDNWSHLYLYDVKTGKQLRQITKGAWCVREVIDVDETKGRILFTASGMNKGEDPYNIHYYIIRLDGKKPC